MISRLEDPAFATVVGILYHACGQEPETSGKSFNLSNLKSSKFTDMFKKILKDFT
jgi:hypothetical protein